MTEICIHRMKMDGVFCSDFEQLKANNTIKFSEDGIAVLYGANGAGKTSLARILSNEVDSEYTLTAHGKQLSNRDEPAFHVIKDQNGRNIIQGNTEDFVLGDNIRREYELKETIETGFGSLYSGTLIPALKAAGISTKKSRFDAVITDPTLRTYVSDLANQKSKGKGIDRNEFVRWISGLSEEVISEYDETKLQFLISDYSGKASVIEKVLALSPGTLKSDPDVMRIEESDDAIRILEKYDYATDCIVCDRDIDRLTLLEKKRKGKEAAYISLSKETKSLLEEIVNLIDLSKDPFLVRSRLLLSIRTGNATTITDIINEFREYFRIYEARIHNLFAACLENSKLPDMLSEYERIVQEKPRFSGEDILFIEKFVNECLNRRIELKRDAENNIRLFLGDKEFLNKDRSALQLSNGEQNFISIAFELLKAKKLDKKFVILDDPISSFDSIYKNKIAYAIIKFLEKKHQIILTHNTDLISLLEHQKQKCFNLYLLNNTEGEQNGFIEVKRSEQDILLYIHRLLDLFRGDISAHVSNEKNFLLSVIPFLRGYCQVIGDRTSRDLLTKIMHGYETQKVNVTAVYEKLFGSGIIRQQVEVSVKDIIAMDFSRIEILKGDTFPLLNKTLRHSLTYLWLRLQVEEKLVNKFSIDTRKYDMLNRIIQKAYGTDSDEDVETRVFLLSRKTLLNEFNHFEVDLNIFKPAIDITDAALAKEKQDILKFLKHL